jgi:hypothetical protein
MIRTINNLDDLVHILKLSKQLFSNHGEGLFNFVTNSDLYHFDAMYVYNKFNNLEEYSKSDAETFLDLLDEYRFNFIDFAKLDGLKLLVSDRQYTNWRQGDFCYFSFTGGANLELVKILKAIGWITEDNYYWFKNFETLEKAKQQYPTVFR